MKKSLFAALPPSFFLKDVNYTCMASKNCNNRSFQAKRICWFADFYIKIVFK